MLETLTENKKQITKEHTKLLLILSLVEFMILGAPELGKGTAHGRKSSPALRVLRKDALSLFRETSRVSISKLLTD